MLKDRLQTSAVLITIIVVLLLLDVRWSEGRYGALALLPLLLFFGLGTAWDAATLLRDSGRAISRWVSLLGALVVMFSAYVPVLWVVLGTSYPADCPVGNLGWIVIGSAVTVFGILAIEMIQYGKGPCGAIDRITGAVFVSLYVGIPMALLAAIRLLGSGKWGLAALLTLIVVTKSSDIGAYFSGRALGGRVFGAKKLIPRLSPGKTREGAVGGILTSTISAFACLHWLFPLIANVSLHPPWYGPLIMGPVLAVAGMGGDLAESLVKRECGAKDSGHLLPGMGGVWDVTDSLLAAAVPGFLCYAAGLAGH